MAVVVIIPFIHHHKHGTIIITPITFTYTRHYIVIIPLTNMSGTKQILHSWRHVHAREEQPDRHPFPLSGDIIIIFVSGDNIIIKHNCKSLPFFYFLTFEKADCSIFALSVSRLVG